MKVSMFAVACLSGFAAVSATQAADLSCTCNLPGRTAVGEVTAVTGSVSLVSRGGAPRVVVGTAVPAGSRVVVGPESGATVAFSRECVVTLPPNSDLVVTGGSSGLCVASRAGMIGALAGAGVAGAGAGAAAAGGLGALGGPAMLAAGAVGVGAIGAAVAIGTSSSRDNKSSAAAPPASR